ncbi:hypothetical protein [Haloferula sargassicola]|uniref:Lipoprotein n=1 Tax=Haloferula sargassicola TaxID=490096 RepID=A0ABP9URS3_9BACT
MKRAFLSAGLGVVASVFPSCVQYYQLPKNYSGPTATIVNTGKAHDAFKSSVYQVAKIDGKVVLTSPMQTPYGGGPVVMMGDSAVTVPAGSPLEVELSGGDRFAADGPALLYSLGGNVSKHATAKFHFTPKANATYVVRGQLGKKESTVWMEDKATAKRFP